PRRAGRPRPAPPPATRARRPPGRSLLSAPRWASQPARPSRRHGSQRARGPARPQRPHGAGHATERRSSPAPPRSRPDRVVKPTLYVPTPPTAVHLQGAEIHTTAGHSSSSYGRETTSIGPPTNTPPSTPSTLPPAYNSGLVISSGATPIWSAITLCPCTMRVPPSRCSIRSATSGPSGPRNAYREVMRRQISHHSVRSSSARISRTASLIDFSSSPHSRYSVVSECISR